MAKKKEKQADELVMDLLTKIKNIFKKDLYIKDGMYLFGGSLSDESVYGDIYCAIEPKYMMALSDFFGKQDLIYIDDVGLLKKGYLHEDEDDSDDSDDESLPSQMSGSKDIDMDWKAHVQFFNKNESVYTDLQNFQNRVSDIIASVTDWKSFATHPEEMINVIFSDNSYVEFQESPDSPYVVLGKRLFPLITAKTFVNVFYGMHELTDRGLNAFCIDYQFTHFRVYMVYYFVGLYQ